MSNNNTNTNQYVPYNQFGYQPFQASQFMLQPQGNIYTVGSSSEIANVPVGAGLSAAICLREGTIYLKTIQNGAPVLLGYKLAPLENFTNSAPLDVANAPAQTQQTIEQKVMTMLESFDKRLKELEGTNKPKGGADKWQL